MDGGEEAGVHLSSWELFQLIPGEIFTLEIRKTWNYRKQLHVSGKTLSYGLEISRLDLTPLRLFPPAFNEVLPWGLVDNRPYLRCLHGYGLCLWRLERFGEAKEVLERKLWLNPSDNQINPVLFTTDLRKDVGVVMRRKHQATPTRYISMCRHNSLLPSAERDSLMATGL